MAAASNLAAHAECGDFPALHEGNNGRDKSVLKRAYVALYGGGAASTAMIVRLLREGRPLDAVIFPDKGNESPDTMRGAAAMDGWLRENYDIGIQTVRERPSTFKPYEEIFHRLESYGVPCYLYLGLPAGKQKHVVLGARAGKIGSRMTLSKKPNVTNLYPLVGWGMTIEDCRRVICEAMGAERARQFDGPANCANGRRGK